MASKLPPLQTLPRVRLTAPASQLYPAPSGYILLPGCGNGTGPKCWRQAKDSLSHNQVTTITGGYTRWWRLTTVLRTPVDATILQMNREMVETAMIRLTITPICILGRCRETKSEFLHKLVRESAGRVHDFFGKSKMEIFIFLVINKYKYFLALTMQYKKNIEENASQ